MSAPTAFCVGCRALLDPGQGCECATRERYVPLDAEAASTIEALTLVVPEIDREDTTHRAIVGSVVVLGPIAVVFVGVYATLGPFVPAIAEQWPWILGVPYLLLAALLGGFLAWSAMEERKPYCSSTSHVRPRPEPAEEARLDAGSLVTTEIHQRREATRIVVRDARIEEALVLRRAGAQILVPAGRVDVVMPPERWRPGPTPLVAEWRALPEIIFGAGVLSRAAARRGDRVLLHGGHLEPLGRDEAGFREASEERFRWIPDDGRTKLVIAG